MNLGTSEPTEAGVSGEQLLVREAGDDDRPTVLELLSRAGWVAAEPDGGAEDASTLVLYDPADGVLRGAITVEALVGGSFQLVAWAVENVDDDGAATTRLVRAAADRLRRSGAARLVVTVDGSGVALNVMKDAGFGVMPLDPDATTSHVTLYQEL